MRKDDLTTDQAKKLNHELFPAINYLVRLKDRMEATGFPASDPLYLLVCGAYDALQRLTNELHYMSCKSGRPEKE